MREYYIVKPVNLDLEKRIKNNPPSFKFNLDFAYMVINDIIQKNAHDEENNNKFIPRSSKILRVYNHLYKEHLRYLGDVFYGSGNVLWREDYGKGKCYGYNLAPGYESTRLEIYVIKDLNLIRKIRENNGPNFKPEVKPRYKFLIKFFDSKRLTIILTEALLFNDELFVGNINYQKYALNVIKILDMQNGKYFMSHKKNTDGRIHSNVTGFPKLFRRFLRYDGKIIAEVDISASVPSFLTFILINTANNQSNHHIQNIIINKAYTNQYMLTKGSVTIDFIEVDRFKILILSGDLYITLVEEFLEIDPKDGSKVPNSYLLKQVFNELGRSYAGDVTDLIKVVKKRMLAMLNAEPIYYKEERAVFELLFPTISAFVTKLKVENHRHFSYLMLQSESYFMLNIVARRLNETSRGKVPLLTIHDCIITTEDNLDFVQTFMMQTFANEMGLKLNLKTIIYN